MPLNWMPSGAVTEAAMGRLLTRGQVVQATAAVRHPTGTHLAHLTEVVMAIVALIHGQLQALLRTRLTLGELQHRRRVVLMARPLLHRTHGVPLLPHQRTHGGRQLHLTHGVHLRQDRQTLGARLLRQDRQTLGLRLPPRHQTLGARLPLDRLTLGALRPPLLTLGDHRQLPPLRTHGVHLLHKTHGVPLLHRPAATLGAHRPPLRHHHLLNPATHGTPRLPPLLHPAAITHGAAAHPTTLGAAARSNLTTLGAAAHSNLTTLGANSQTTHGAARPHLRLPSPTSTAARTHGTHSLPLRPAANTHSKV